MLNQLESILNVYSNKIHGRAKELFEKWKNFNKTLTTGKVNEQDLILTSKKIYQGDILTELSQFLNVKKDQIPSKIKKILSEWKDGKKKLKQMHALLSTEHVKKMVKNAKEFNNYKLVLASFDNLTQKDLTNLSVKVLKQSNDIIPIFLNKTNEGIMIMGMLGSNPLKNLQFDMGKFVKECVNKFTGKGGGRKDYGQGFIPNPEQEINEVLSYIKNKLLVN